MDPIRLFRRYAVFLKLPKEVTTRITKWYNVQVVQQGVLGCHALLKRVCLQLRYWLLARADGVKCVLRAPWVSVTGAGFPRLFTGLQTMSQDTLTILVSLHKVFKPKSVKELPPQIVQDRFSDVVRPYDGSSFAISDALSLIQIGTRHLQNPEFMDYSDDSRTIWDPNHEVQPSGIDWLHRFYKRNEYWLSPCEAVMSFYPFNPTVEPERQNTGHYETLTRGGKPSSLFDPSFMMMGEYQMSAEPGFKARAFFSPNLLIQSVSEPIHKYLRDIEKDSGYSVRYLETEAKVSQIQTWLNDGAVVSSIDQTAATDRFPLRLQLYTAHCLGVPPEYIRFMAKVSRGSWRVTDSLVDAFGSDTICLAVGQPMGLSFSMPLYTLSMITLLLGACDRWGFTPDFLVLGDDLVVRDEGLALWCHDFLPKIGVSISTSKGVTSSNIAEFAGAFVGKDFFTFPGKMPVVDDRTWYSCSVRLAQPLPDGCPKASTNTKLVESFWLSRIAALGCYGDIVCPIENGVACNTIIQRLGFSEEILANLLTGYIDYDIQRLRDSSRSLIGQITSGLLTSRTSAVSRMCYTVVDNDHLFNVLDREDKLLRQGFEMHVSKTAYQLHSVLGIQAGVGFSTFLKPKGSSTEEWVSHVLKRMVAILMLDSPNWYVKYSVLAQRHLLSSLLDLCERLRELLWERRQVEHKRIIARSSSFCHYLVKH